MISSGKVPVTIITGFLGAGKTTLVRHVLEHAAGRRIAVIVNEFGAVGIDGELLRSCSIAGCADEDIVELANGCLCCTVAEDFLPTMQALIDRPNPPEYILIETSGLALPKPLLKAFGWPAIRTRERSRSKCGCRALSYRSMAARPACCAPVRIRSVWCRASINSGLQKTGLSHWRRRWISRREKCGPYRRLI